MKLKLLVLLSTIFISSCDNISDNQTTPKLSQTSKRPISKEIIPIVIPTVECTNLKYSYTFNPKYILTVELTEETNVKISILNMNEEPLRELVNRCFPVGLTKVFWDRRDDKGKLVVDDFYIHICKLETLIKENCK